MNRDSTIPLEFSELSGKVQYVVRRGSQEWSSSCPQCGGAPHKDGTFPDRFRMLVQSRATGRPLGWCRSCNYSWWPGKDSGREWTPTPEQQRAWIAERELSEHDRAAATAHALELLQQERVWIKYHDQMTDAVRDIYFKRGIPEFWQLYLKLGYNPTKNYSSGGVYYSSDALTIPVFEPGTWRVLNIKNRLLHPADPGDKYRPEIKGLPAAMYAADPDVKLEGRCLLVEGEFKAIVAYTTLDDTNTVVMGLPSKSPELQLLQQLAKCDPVVICLDPDALRCEPGQQQTAVDRIARVLGKRARVMRLTDKVDDLVNAGHLDKASLRRLVDTARVVNHD